MLLADLSQASLGCAISKSDGRRFKNDELN
jgi:hypothetical protein